MKSNNCDKANVTKKNAHAWSIDGNNTFKFEQDRENNELYLRGLFSGQKIHVDVIITGSVKRQITAGQKTYVSPPSSHFWCLCWRRNTSYRKILKWSDAKNIDKGISNDNKTAWFVSQDGFKVVIDMETASPLSTAQTTLIIAMTLINLALLCNKDSKSKIQRYLLWIFMSNLFP